MIITNLFAFVIGRRLGKMEHSKYFFKSYFKLNPLDDLEGEAYREFTFQSGMQSLFHEAWSGIRLVILFSYCVCLALLGIKTFMSFGSWSDFILISIGFSVIGYSLCQSELFHNEDDSAKTYGARVLVNASATVFLCVLWASFLSFARWVK